MRGRYFSAELKLGRAVLSTVLMLGLGACSMPKLPTLGGPAPDQPQELDCAALDAERARLLAEREDLNAPLLASKTDAQRDAELTQLNGKLYTVAKAQSDKRCPAVANGSTGSVAR